MYKYDCMKGISTNLTVWVYADLGGSREEGFDPDVGVKYEEVVVPETARHANGPHDPGLQWNQSWAGHAAFKGYQTCGLLTSERTALLKY